MARRYKKRRARGPSQWHVYRDGKDFEIYLGNSGTPLFCRGQSNIDDTIALGGGANGDIIIEEWPGG